jgi:opacity protein-like surface antigen
MLAILMVFGVRASASDFNPLGFYVGASVGRANARIQDNEAFNYYSLGFQDNDAWKVFAGLRPLSLVGAEVSYTDFGNVSGPPPPSTILGYFNDDARQHAVTVFGMGYLPLPVPFLDVYGKLGVARLHSQERVTDEPPTCPVGYSCAPYTVAQDRWSTDLAYGAGAQAKILAFAVRAEYERIAPSSGYASLFSLGVTYTF